jgi:surface carbohydrate biosynthesis protein
MDKVLIVLDHKDRDLGGVSLIAYHLFTSFGIFPIICTTKNELSCLIKYSPKLILVQHVRHSRQRYFLEFAKNRGIKIAILPCEGFPRRYQDMPFGLGEKEFLFYLDYAFLWGELLATSCKKSENLKNCTIKSIGSPRFDLYHLNLHHIPPKKIVCDYFGFDSKLPLILWTTNFKYSNWPGGIDKLIELIKLPTTSDHRLHETIDKKARDHQRGFDFSTEAFDKLIVELKNFQFIIKVHPNENIEFYHRRYSKFPHVKIIQSLKDLSLYDLLRAADVQIAWRCTTSAESWIFDQTKIVIDYEPDDLLLNEFEYLASGNDIVKNYETLKEKIIYYIENPSVDPLVMSKRLNFIKDYLHSADGKSALRCAQEISDICETKIKLKWNFKSILVYLRHLPRYRFRKNWQLMLRDKTHIKYIGLDDILSKMELFKAYFKKDYKFKFN